MGCLLNLSIRLNPRRRRWRPRYPICRQQACVSLRDQDWHGGLIDRSHDYLLLPSLKLIRGDDYDDKHVVSCDNIYTDRVSFGAGGDCGGEKTTEEGDDGTDQCEGNHDRQSGVCEDGDVSLETRDGRSACEECHERDDCGSSCGGGQQESDNEGDQVGLLSGGYGELQQACCCCRANEKEEGQAGMRARGIEGYWQRQAYLHSAYKFSRRRSLCERVMVPVGKIRTAWGVMRGMYAKQARRMRRQLTSIAGAARFHHASFLLLSRLYGGPPPSLPATLSFRSLSGAFHCRQQ